MIERHGGACDFERRFPQGLLCGINDIPEGCGAIYLITNLLNDKVYVGQTWVGIWKRWKSHIRSAKTGRCSGYFQWAIKKDKPENFALGILAAAPTQEELDNLETLWIVILGSFRPDLGYNLTLGGSAGRPNEELRSRISGRMTEAWSDPEFREKMLLAQAPMYSDPEYLQKLSEGSKEFWTSPEGIEKRSKTTTEVWKNPSYRAKVLARIQSPEDRKRQSGIIKELWATPEHRAKVTEGIKNRPWTEEDATRSAERSRKFWEDPKYRESISSSMKEVWQDPEYRARRSESLKQASGTKECRDKKSAAATAMWENPEFHQRMTETRQAKWSDPVWKEAVLSKRKQTVARKAAEKLLQTP